MTVDYSWLINFFLKILGNEKRKHNQKFKFRASGKIKIQKNEKSLRDKLINERN